jgi:hypothetical protein
MVDPPPTNHRPRHETPHNGAGAFQPHNGADAFQPVLTIRARVNQRDAAAFTRQALREIHAYINERDIEVEGPPFSICHPLPHDRVDLEAGWPARGAPDHGNIHTGALPITQLRQRTRSWTGTARAR